MCTVSRRVLNRTKQQLSAHARLTSAAVQRYKSAVDDVSWYVGRFERHLAVALDTSWLTFPNTLLNKSVKSERASEKYDSSMRRSQLANLLQIDEAQVVYRWTRSFWTRFDCRCFSDKSDPREIIQILRQIIWYDTM